jgi:hypothetical protein
MNKINACKVSITGKKREYMASGPQRHWFMKRLSHSDLLQTDKAIYSIVRNKRKGK